MEDNYQGFDNAKYKKDPFENQNKGNLENFLKNKKRIQLLKKKGVQSLFPIQYQTFFPIYKKNDIIAKDRTGSGKTLAFALPIIQRFRQQNLSVGTTKFLIVLPTRQLAFQVKNEISSILISDQQFSVVAVYGGTSVQEQAAAVKRGADIVVSTPGRLLDFLQRQVVKLNDLKVICFDQADEMLKQGFKEDVEKIFEYINKNNTLKIQTLLFSATIPQWVFQLSQKYLDPNHLFIDLIKDQNNKTSKTIVHYAFQTHSRPTPEQISDIIEQFCGNQGKCMIFAQTKREVNEIGTSGMLRQKVVFLHGDVPQFRRQKAIQQFRLGIVKCLVATNVAARGLDFPSIDLIVQIQPPKDVQTYIHRSGRTGRAGKSGVSVLCYTKYQSFLKEKIQQIAKIRFKILNKNKNNNVNTPQFNQYNRRSQTNNNNSNQYSNSKNFDQQQYPKTKNFDDQVVDAGYSKHQPIQHETTFSKQPSSFLLNSNFNSNTSNNTQLLQEIHFPSDFTKELHQVQMEQIEPYFQSIAKQVFKNQRSQLEALTKLLFYLMGGKKQYPRASLITGSEDKITYKLSVPFQAKGLDDFTNILNKFVPKNYSHQILNMRRIKKNQIIFDIRKEISKKFDALSSILNTSVVYAGYKLQQKYQVKLKQNIGRQFAPLSSIRNCILNKSQYQLYIEDLPVDITQDEIKKFFINNDVELIAVKLCKVKDQANKRQALALCADARSVRYALQLNNQILKNRIIKIDLISNLKDY